MRFGLFGTGPWAHQAHAPALAAHDDVEFVGVWGRDAGKAAALAETTTNDKGEFTLKAEVEAGDYTVMAGNREAGMGREMISIKAGEKPSKVSITLRASKKK